MRKVLSFLDMMCTTVVFSVFALLVSLFDHEGEKVHRVARLWARIHLKVCGITVQTEGLENVSNPPYIFMCNHQSALDIYVLLASLPITFKWIAKRSLFYVPFFGWIMKRAGYISLDRENPREALKAIRDAARKIREGTSIIIFPEGTRSKDGSLLPFKAGGFSLAFRAKVPIVPIGIQGTHRLQPKGSFVAREKGVVSIRLGKPVQVEELTRSAKERVMDEVRTEIERLMACRAN
jgi:1-acyl-sn-glycerol-3-phosphate acyltransferase